MRNKFRKNGIIKGLLVATLVFGTFFAPNIVGVNTVEASIDKDDYVTSSSYFGDFRYRHSKVGNVVMITGYTGTNTDLEIPYSIEGKPVVAINGGTFDYATTGVMLTSVKIPNSVTQIGDWAFEGNSLTEVKLPPNLSYLGEGAFTKNKITEMSFPSSLTSIGEEAFSENLLTSINIGSSVVEIQALAFADNKLTSVVIPPTVLRIGIEAFDDNLLLNIFGESGSEAEAYSTRENKIFSNMLANDSDLRFNLEGGILALLSRPIIDPVPLKRIEPTLQTYTTGISNSLNLIDSRGTYDGWSVTVSSSQLSVIKPATGWVGGVEPKKFPRGTIKLTGVKEVLRGDNSNLVGDDLANVKAKDLTNSPSIDESTVTIASAKEGYGSGEFKLMFSPDAVSVTVDPETAVIDRKNYPNGATPYGAIVTWTLVSGPGL